MKIKKVVQLVVIALLIGGIILPVSALAQQKQKTNEQVAEEVFAKVSDAELSAFFQWIMTQVADHSNKSQHFSPLTKGRIAWMFDNAGQNFTLSKKIVGGPGWGEVSALAGFKAGKPAINVNFGKLVQEHWQSYQTKSALSLLDLNNMVIMFAHEVIHLQHGPLLIEVMKTDPPLLAFEERRTWAQSVIEDVRPLVQKGQPLHGDYVVAEQLLRSCNDDMDCPAFKNFTGTRTAPTK